MKCPECSSTHVAVHHSFPHQVQYGQGEDAVVMVYEAQTLQCRSCGLVYDGEEGLMAHRNAVERYKKAFAA